MPHGNINCCAFRVGGLCYISDVSDITDTMLHYINNSEVVFSSPNSVSLRIYSWLLIVCMLMSEFIPVIFPSINSSRSLKSTAESPTLPSMSISLVWTILQIQTLLINIYNLYLDSWLFHSFRMDSTTSNAPMMGSPFPSTIMIITTLNNHEWLDQQESFVYRSQNKMRHYNYNFNKRG